MGDLLQLFDLNQERMARKYFTENSHVCGMVAPWNSLELPVRVCKSCDGALQDNLMYTDQNVHLIWPEKNCFPTDTSVKLTNENTSKRTKSKGNTLSVVARLMGVDMLPLDSNLVLQQVEETNDTPLNKFLKQKLKKSGSLTDEDFFSLMSSRETMFGSCQHKNKRDSAEWDCSMHLNTYKRREHPREEELQKFKRDFEAWQTERFEECAKVVESGKSNQLMMQKDLNNEKMVPYTNSGSNIRINESSREHEARVVKGRGLDSGDLKNNRDRRDIFRAKKGDSLSLRNRDPSEAFECSSIAFPDPKLENSSAPMKITILKPGLDTIKDYKESWDRSSRITEESDNMEDFLMEVKERLKRELQGKASTRGTAVRGGGIETPYSEKPSNPKQIAQRIAKKVRESVIRDLGVNLNQSELTRSYRSEFQYSGTGSPEFISRDTRNCLSERLRNALKGETRSDIPTADDSSSSSSMLSSERDRLQDLREVLSSGNGISCLDSVKTEQDKNTRSFRCDADDDIVIHKDLSPTILIRSLSAPVSGTSFGKLLLEDRHLLTGAHIKRKHEVTESIAMKVKEQKKEKFNLRKRVSSFRYSLTLRGKLFRRRVQSPEKITNAPNFLNDGISGATVMLNFCDRQNSTEVPPSPASICSSGYEELQSPAEYYSSKSDLHPVEENSLPHVFREISSNLHELRRKLNQLDASDSGEIMIEEQPSEAVMVELQDQSEAYVRDLLVASGFYNCSADKSLSRWDPFAKPIANNIFEEVEESCMKRTKNNEETMNKDDKEIDHKVLFDLLNEALSNILEPPMTMSKFRKQALGTNLRSAYGRKLLSHVWNIMCVYVHPSADKTYSLEGMVARDLESTPWSVLINDGTDAVGKEIECWVVGDLIEEIIDDMKPL